MDANEKNNPSTAPTKAQVEGWRKGKDRSFSPRLYQINYDLSTPQLDFCATPGLVDKKCVRCGKNFVPTRPKYAWQDCCSYTCYMHRDDNKTIPNGKPVNQYTEDGYFIRTFKSAVEAAKEIGLKKADNIRDCCNGKTKKSAGFIWRWKEETND